MHSILSDIELTDNPFKEELAGIFEHGAKNIFDIGTSLEKPNGSQGLITSE